MPNLRPLVLCVLTAACAHGATGQPLDPAREAIEGAQALEHIKVLSSPPYEGRGVDTQGIERAATYLAQHFERLGLRPGGDSGTYFQSFPQLVGRRVAPESRLTTLGRTLEVGADLAVVPGSGSGAVQGPIVFAGYGITDARSGYDDYKGLDVKDKLVLVLRYAPGAASPSADPAHGIDAQHTRLVDKIQNARDHGAAAVILVNPPGADADDLIARGPTEGSIPAVHIRRPLALELARAGGLDLAAAAAQMDLTGKPAGRPLAGVRASVYIRILEDRRTLKNVVAVLPGSDPALAREVVVIGGHYDHHGFGGGWGARGAHGQLHPGADDNASGTSAVLEIAEAFALRRERPRRTLVFVGFTGEERGLWGSKHYVEHPVAPLDRTVLMINLDMVGRLKDGKSEVEAGRGKVLDVGGVGTSAPLRGLVEQANREKLDIVFDESGEAPSDNHTFYNRKVPVLFLFSGMHPDYHLPSDTWDKIDADGLGKSARLAYRVATAVADSDLRLAFQPTRTKSLFASLSQNGRSFPRLGLTPAYGAQAEGMAVAAVRPGGAAEKAGIKDGDVLVRLGTTSVRSVEEYMNALAKHRGGEEVQIEVVRKGQKVTLRATLEAPRNTGS